MTPVLHPHNRHQPRQRESTGCHPHSRTYRQRRLPRFPGLDPPVPASRAAARARAGGPQRGAPRWGVPRASIPNQQAGFRGVKSGSCVRAWEGGGGRATRRSRSRRPSRRRRTDLGEARLTGRGLILYADHGKHAGCGCCWREVVSIAHLACTFRVVWVVEDYNVTFERFEGSPGV